MQFAYKLSNHFFQHHFAELGCAIESLISAHYSVVYVLIVIFSVLISYGEFEWSRMGGSSQWMWKSS